MASILGETKRLTVEFQQAGVLFDPNSVIVLIKPPVAVATTVGPGAPIVHTGTGLYYLDLVTTEVGSTTVTWVAVDAAGNLLFVPDVVEVAPVRLMPRAMTSDELDQCVGPLKVDQLFDDAAAGVRDQLLVSQALRRAEDYAMGSLLDAWGEDAVVLVLQNDAVARMHVAWICLELAAERRGEFLGVDGKGPYWSQLVRAEKYLDGISRGRTSSVGEAVGGRNAQVGGSISPTLRENQSRFVFAPDRRNPTGHGGYLWVAAICFELVWRALQHWA